MFIMSVNTPIITFMALHTHVKDPQKVCKVQTFQKISDFFSSSVLMWILYLGDSCIERGIKMC